MKANLEELKAHVTGLSDDALLGVDPGELVESARAVYEAELAARGLSWSSAESTDSSNPDIDPEYAAATASVAKYDTLEEARFARNMLRAQEIPAWFKGEMMPDKMVGDPDKGLELMTTPEFLDQALLLLESQVSDEELARQAAAAATPQEEEEQDEPDGEEGVE